MQEFESCYIPHRTFLQNCTGNICLRRNIHVDCASFRAGDSIDCNKYIMQSRDCQ
ncbi:MAG: DUF2576 domain-containing protein [Ruminococcaceae bacterium]|nr:DUF2576 domain-containing protein [Oscillospiraceae bacterium]